MTHASWLTRTLWRAWWWLQNRADKRVELRLSRTRVNGEAEVRDALYGSVPKPTIRTHAPIIGARARVHSRKFHEPLSGVVIAESPTTITVRLDDTGIVAYCNRAQVEVIE